LVAVVDGAAEVAIGARPRRGHGPLVQDIEVRIVFGGAQHGDTPRQSIFGRVPENDTLTGLWTLIVHVELQRYRAPAQKYRREETLPALSHISGLAILVPLAKSFTLDSGRAARPARRAWKGKRPRSSKKFGPGRRALAPSGAGRPGPNIGRAALVSKKLRRSSIVLMN